MKKTIDIKADIGDRIHVPALELKNAVVIAIYMGQHRTTYEMAYFHNGDRKTCYLNDDEFELMK